MPVSPTRPGGYSTLLSSSPRGTATRSESSPLLPRQASGTADVGTRASLRASAQRDHSAALSDDGASTAVASSLSVNNSSGGGPSYHNDSEGTSGGSGGSSRARSNASEGSGKYGTSGGSILGSTPSSLSGFLTIFSHSVGLQSWTSFLLAVSFHVFHLALIISFLMSPILFRSTIFSSQTMAKALLESQGVIKHRAGEGHSSTRNGTVKSGAGKGGSRNASSLLLPTSVSRAPVAVESVWAIHDAVFFLESGHVVMPTTIANSFGSLRRGKDHKKGDEKNKKDAGKEEEEGTATGDGKGDDDDDDNGGGDNTHTYIVPHMPGGTKDGTPDTTVAAQRLLAQPKRMLSLSDGDIEIVGADGTAESGQQPEVQAGPARRAADERNVVALASTEGERMKEKKTSTSVAPADRGPFYSFAAPPPVAPQLPLSQRKRATHGRTTLSKMLDAWEASPLYSSPLALTLFYYLYSIGCVILLLTVTDGMLTGHFSVLRLIISLAELLWFVHHGAHAFVIYCWMLLLSHWPHQAAFTRGDTDFLRRGVPFAVVSKESGEVAMYWFYRATAAAGSTSEGKIVQSQINTRFYLYDQAWYLKPVASGIAVVFLALVSLCIARDLHRMLDAVVGVRVLMEPEGCVRCPLCGELMEVCHRAGNVRGKSIYQSAREGTSLSVRRTMWWWRWLRSAVRGSSSGHRVPTPRLHSPLWRWLLPGWCGGGPQGVEASLPREADGIVSLEALASDEAPYTIADMLDDIDFYEQSAVRRSAAAPQDTMAEETAHLMRWLTVVPKADAAVAVPVKGDRSGSDSDDEEAADALGIGSSGSSSSEDEVERGLVKAMPSAAAAAPGGPAGDRPSRQASPTATGPRQQRHQQQQQPVRSPTSSRSLQSPRHSNSHHYHYHQQQQQRQSLGTPRRTRHHSHARSQTSAGSSQRAAKPSRVTRFKEEVLYWNYATRHVHHRCPKLYLDAREASDDDEDNSGSSDGEGSTATSGSSSAASSSVASVPPPGAAGGSAGSGAKGRRVTGTLASSPVATAATRAHVGDAPTAASRAAFSDRGMRRSLSPRAAGLRRAEPSGTPASDAPSMAEERRRQQQQVVVAALQRTTSAGTTGSRRGVGGLYKPGEQTVGGGPRNYGTIGPNFSEGPSQLYASAPPQQAAANHIVQRGVYDPTKDEEDDFRPGNAFQSFDRASWLSRLTYSWLDALLSFGLLEPTLLRQERFLPALPEQLLSLDNIAVPAWRLWVHRKVWYASYVAKPGELLIPSNEAMERAEEQVMSLADLYDPELSDNGDETESSEGRQTVVMLGHTSLKQAAKFRPHRPRRSWEEQALWGLTAPLRYLLVVLFYYVYIGTSRTVRRTRRRLVRELLKDRLVAAAEDMYDEHGYQAMEANEAIEEATWALAEMASSCGSSAAAPSAGSALPTHMRRQLALSDVSLYYLFLEHPCGRRFLLVAAPLLLLSEVLTLSLVPVLAVFVQYLQRVDTIEILPGRRETPTDQENITTSLGLAALLGGLLMLQGVVQNAYVSQVQQAAMEARTCVRAMVMEKTLALPLAQRTFSEDEVVTLATEEATRVAKCLLSLHHTWSCPLRVLLLSAMLGIYLGWAAAGVACVGPLLIVPWLRHAEHESQQSRHRALGATGPRLSLLQQALGHIREVKGMLLEGRIMRRLRRARAAEAAHAEEVAMADGTVGVLAGGVTGLLMVVALGAECIFSDKALREMDVLIPTLIIFVLLSTPLLELPALFTLVARGFLSMKRIEAYLRQTPDEFVGTWVDLTTFSAMQQQLRKENPTSALLHYRRGSVVCRDSSFTWQHDLTEETPATLLRGVDMRIEPGQLVVVQGSMGSGKSTLLLSILGEVNRCVSATGTASVDGDSVTDYESESTLSVVSASEAAAVGVGLVQAAVPSAAAAEQDGPGGRLLSNTTNGTFAFPSRGSMSGLDSNAALAVAAAHGIFVASPSQSTDGRRRQRAEASVYNGSIGGGSSGSRAGSAALTAAHAPLPHISTTAATDRSPTLRGREDAVGYPPNATAARSGGHAADDVESTAAPTEGSQRHPAGLEEGERSTGGFLVFGSCAYCAEVPWLQNDTIRANIMASGGPVQLERWYYTVLRACALNAEVAALPQGDATVVGDRGEVLSLSMRCRIAIARAVYSKSHVYLFDSVLSPLEPLVREHIIREVFHKLLRKRTVILASNVGLRSLRPHRVFSVVEGGVVREDTELYKAVSSLHARSSDEDEDGDGDGGGGANNASSSNNRSRTDERGAGRGSPPSPSPSFSSRSSSSGNTSQGTAAPLPPLYAEEFEEPQEESEMNVSQTFEHDPMAAATALLFDGDEDFGPRDPLFPELGGDRYDGAGNDTTPALSFFYANSGPSSGALRPRRSVHFGPRSPTRPDAMQRSMGASGRTSPGFLTLPPPAVPLPGCGADQSSAGAASLGASGQLNALSTAAASSHVSYSTPVDGQNAAGREDDGHGNDAASSNGGGTNAASDAASSCSTGQYIRNHYAQQLERERMLRHRHRLSFFIFLRFMGGQVLWLLFTTFLQQLLFIGLEVWAAVWLAVMANAATAAGKDDAAAAAVGKGSGFMATYGRLRHQLYTWAAVTDTVFLGTVCALTALTMVVTLLRTRAVYVGVYGTMHFIYNQIVSRVLHAPASYFDSRIIALLTRVLDGDAEVAEYRVPSTAEVLLSCVVQIFFIAAWNSFVNPIFLLLLPVTISLFYHISQRHAVVLREVRKLETGSVSGMADILREVYQGASTVRCMALHDRLREEYCRALDTVNTASMVAYLADRWVELRLHVLTALAVSSTAMLGVVFTVSYSRPSFTAVAIIAALRAGPVLSTLCKSLGAFSVLEWISVQRLMSLWSVPQEPLTLVGEADLYNYSHVRRRATGLFVELEGGHDAPLVDLVGTPVISPGTLAVVTQQQEQQQQQVQHVTDSGPHGGPAATGSADAGEPGATSAALPQTPLTAFAAVRQSSSASSSSSSSHLELQPSAPRQQQQQQQQQQVQQREEEVATITLPHLELRNVSARYRTTLPYVLRHVNLAVYPGERLGVVGHAGQGKGSIFNVLMRLVDVIEGGGVFVDGEDAARVPYPILRGWFGLIPQEPLLVHGSWRSNLLMGYHPEHRLLIQSANGSGDRPYLPIATLARQRQLEKSVKGAPATTPTTAAAAIAQHLAEQNNAEQQQQRTAAAAVAGESAVSLPTSESYASVDSVQAFQDEEEPAQRRRRQRQRYLGSTEEADLSRDASRGPAGGKRDGGGSMVARVTRRLRDRLSGPFRRHGSRSAGGRRDRTPSVGDAGTSRGSSCGGGRRRRRRGSRQPLLNVGSGHVVEGPQQPVEDAALWAALRAVGLDTVVEFDGGLDAPLTGGDVSETDLTESQCRLLCLARAVLNKPPIVLLEDAVLSGAEAQTDRAIRRVLANELRDSTVIIIAHRMSTVLNLCTRVVAMRAGTLLPLADLRSAASSVDGSRQPQVGLQTQTPNGTVVADVETPTLAAQLNPEVLKQLSYYVE